MNTLLSFLRGLFQGMWAAFTAGGAQAPAAAPETGEGSGSAPQDSGDGNAGGVLPAIPEPPAGVGPQGVFTYTALRQIMPSLPLDKLHAYFQPLTEAMQEFAVDTSIRAAAFLAQLAHESGELRYMEEIASGAAYEGRRDLGNTEPGDGVRYKGRGPIQLTGRANYRRCGAALGLDLEGDPEQAATPQVGFRIAGWYWTTHPAVARDCNQLADMQDFIGITRAINGGLNGLASREAYYARAKAVLGA